MYVVNRFAQMCAYGFEAGLSALKAADVPDEEERATHKTVCKDFYADATARSEFDVKYTDEMSRGAAACAIGAMVVF